MASHLGPVDRRRVVGVRAAIARDPRGAHGAGQELGPKQMAPSHGGGCEPLLLQLGGPPTTRRSGGELIRLPPLSSAAPCEPLRHDPPVGPRRRTSSALPRPRSRASGSSCVTDLNVRWEAVTALPRRGEYVMEEHWRGERLVKVHIIDTADGDKRLPEHDRLGVVLAPRSAPEPS